MTVISLADGKAVNVGFEAYDSAEARQALTDAGIVLKKGAVPSKDLEPEYIAAGNSTAYVTLQEANAIAAIDLNSLKVTGIYSAGYEDYSTVAVDIDKKDEAYNPKTYESLRGIRMPDSIALYSVDGTDYVVTANEGDSREWGDYLNEDERDFKDGQTSPTGKITAENSGLTGKVVFFDSSDYDGLDANLDYLFGGRSFTVYKADGNGLTEVFDSGSDFEAKTAIYVPENFNCSNDDKSIDDRSGKKGPESESVTLGTVGEKTYAFVGLERVGGVMVYDITDPAHISFANYINSRDYSEDIAGDNSPEGLCFIPAGESWDGNAYLVAACEVSGTVAVYGASANTAYDPGTENPDDGQKPGDGDDQNPDDGQKPGTGGEDQKPGTADSQTGGQSTSGKKAARTGDGSNYTLYLLLALAAAGSATAVIVIRRRKAQ